MSFQTPTDPNAAKVEAAELRAQATRLNAQADALDPPTPVEEKADKPATKKKPSSKKKPATKKAETKKGFFNRGKK